MKKRFFFYANVRNKRLFSITGFYQTDIQILKDLGYEVYTSNSIGDFLKFWKYDNTFIYFWTWGLLPAFISKLFKKKVYFTGGIDSLDKEFNNSPKEYLKHRLFFKLCCKFSDGNIIVSKSDIINIEKTGLRVQNINLIPHVIDFEKYQYHEEKKEDIITTIAWMETKENVIRKGIDRLMCLFKEISKTHPTYKLVIIGTTGLGSDYLIQIANKLNLNEKVFFTGAITEKEKIFFLKKSKFYFQLSKYEGFGIAPLEAMAAGNLIAHSGKGALRYTMQDLGINIDLNKSDIEIVKDLNVFLSDFDFHRSKMNQGINYIKKNYSYTIRKDAFKKLIK